LRRDSRDAHGLRCFGHHDPTTTAAAPLGGPKRDGDLDKLGPEQPGDAGIKHAAKVFAALPYVTVSADVIAARLLLFGPFVKALFLEVACMSSSASASATPGSRAGERGRPRLPRPQLPPSCRRQGNRPSKATERQGKTTARQPRRQPSRADVIAALARAGRPLSNEQLAAELGVTEGAASRIRKHEASQLSVERRVKELQISLAARH
jgi:hypothetical protein